MLLFNRSLTLLSDLVQCLVFAVLLEVILVVFLLEDPREAMGIVLRVPLAVKVLLYDIFVLEVVEVGVLSLE